MSYAIKLILILLPLAGCKKDKDLEPKKGDDDPNPQEACVEASDCPGWQFCDVDSGECEDGDLDNGIDDAASIRIDEWMEGYIFPENDVDYFEFKADEPMWVRVETKSNTSDCSVDCSVDTSSDWDPSVCFDNDPDVDLDTLVTIRKANGATHASMDDFATGPILVHDTILLAYLPEAGKWYITVEDVSGRGDKDYFYCLDVEEWGNITQETDDETNPSEALDLSSLTAIYSIGVNLEDSGDSDWIELHQNWDGQIMVLGVGNFSTDANPGSDAVSRIRLYDGPAGNQLFEQDDLGMDGTIAWYLQAQRNNDYILEATDAFGNSGPDVWYVLYFTTDDDTEGHEVEVEPNDTQGTANLSTIEVGTTTNGTDYDFATALGTLDPSSDEDWFEMNMLVDQYFTVQCIGDDIGALGDIQMELVNSSGTVVLASTDGDDNGPDELNFIVPMTDDYTVRLFSQDALYGPGVYYLCRFYVTDFELVFN